MITRPMKGAAVDDLTKIRLPCIAFPKIDGFRCILGETAMTSRLGPFPNRTFRKDTDGLLPKGRMLDGELVVGRRRGKGVLQKTSSGVTSEDGNPNWTLWVFDQPLIEGPFEVRYDAAAGLVKTLNHPRIRLLKGKLIKTLKQLKRYLKKQLKRGYEGIVTRSIEGLWKNGKSTLREQGLLKVKPFDTAEARVTGYYEEQQNTNEAKREATGKLKRSSAKSGKVAKGTLGGLIGIDVKSGVEVRVGGGFTKTQRERLWAIRDELNGKLFKYKKQMVGEKDKPRHPNFDEFVDWRPDWDMTED